MCPELGPTISRRVSLFGLGILLSAPVFAQSEANAATIRLRVEQQALLRIPQRARQGVAVQPDDSPEARSLAADVPPTHAIPILFIVAGVLTLPVLYDAIVEMIRETIYGGVIMDFRTSPPTITNSKAIPANLVQRIMPDGKIEAVPSQSFLLPTLRAWLGQGKTSAQ